MKNNKTLFMVPSIFIFLLLSAFPIFKILVDIKKKVNIYVSVGSIIYLLLLILLSISVIVEIIYLVNYLFTKTDMKLINKLLWTILLLAFNILIIPYFYMRYVSKEDKLVSKSLIYLIPIILFSFILFYGIDTYNKELNIQREERKKIEEERNEYKTKDNLTTFIFRHGYKVSEVGEYDLYVQNKAKNIIFTAFTYDTTKYEQKTADDFINKGVSDISNGKEKFDLSKEKEVIDLDDKTITTVEYLGKTKESSLCVYKISVIIFKDKPDYLVYTVEVITKNNYDLYKKELLEILKNSKKN